MNIFIIEKNNGTDDEFYQHYIEGATISYREATEKLMQEGFLPYPVEVTKEGKTVYDLWFEKEYDKPYGISYSRYYKYEDVFYDARIVETTLQV